MSVCSLFDVRDLLLMSVLSLQSAGASAACAPAANSARAMQVSVGSLVIGRPVARGAARDGIRSAGLSALVGAAELETRPEERMLPGAPWLDDFGRDHAVEPRALLAVEHLELCRPQ